MTLPETLARYGWRPIVSDAHAAQLLRRELKHHARHQQRGSGVNWDYRTLLAITRGNWYKLMGNPDNGHCGILIWRMRQCST